MATKLRANAADIARRTSKRVSPVIADVSNENGVKLLVREAEREFGRVDVLDNNAGMTFVKPAEELTGEE